MSRRWSVRVVRRRDGALYTGISTDVHRRILEHARKMGKGAKSLRGRGPLHLVFQRVIGSRGIALRVEGTIKKLLKAGKEELIVQKAMVDSLIHLARSSRKKIWLLADASQRHAAHSAAWASSTFG